MGFETLHDAEGQFFKKNRVASGGKVFELRANDRLPTDLKQDPFSSNIENAVQPDNMYFPALNYDEILWTPSQIDTILWLDAAAEWSITISNEFGQMSQWDDRSTLGTNHAIMPVEFSQPAYTVDAKPNGRRAVRFISGRYMTANSLTTSLNSGSYEAYMVVNFDALGVVQRVFRNDASFPSFAEETFAWGGSDFQYVDSEISGTPNVFELDSFYGSAPVAGTPSLFRTAYDRTADAYGSISMTANGYIGFEANLLLSGDKGNYQTFTLSSISSGLTGYLYEIIFVPSVLSKENRQLVEGYLAWKWNIPGNLPANHPYKNQAPGNFAY